LNCVFLNFRVPRECLKRLLPKTVPRPPRHEDKKRGKCPSVGKKGGAGLWVCRLEPPVMFKKRVEGRAGRKKRKADDACSEKKETNKWRAKGARTIMLKSLLTKRLKDRGACFQDSDERKNLENAETISKKVV